MNETVDQTSYWERRLGDSYTLGSVGWASLGQSFNRWMYAVRRRVFTRLVRDCVPELSRAHVLDLGSGTGFYLGLWQELGVRERSGSDLASVAVAHLQEAYPDAHVHQLDISGEPDTLPVEEYDVISAIDMLYHVIDDQRYAQAMCNISRMLKPGGILIFSENLPKRAIVTTHQVSRTRIEVDRALAAAQLEPIARRPMFFLMNNPLDSDNRLLKRWWSRVMRICYRGELAGWLLGATIYPFELALVRMTSRSPSSKIIAARKTLSTPMIARPGLTTHNAQATR
ncbi:MAG: class I SAM-dependent methyltransferase [Solirubrobacteraceae bacterium]